jgi:hypothetical protein
MAPSIDIGEAHLSIEGNVIIQNEARVAGENTILVNNEPDTVLNKEMKAIIEEHLGQPIVVRPDEKGSVDFNGNKIDSAGVKLSGIKTD